MQQQNRNGSTRRIGDVLEGVIQEQSVRPRPMGTDGLRTGLRALDGMLGDLPHCETVGVVGRCGVVSDTLLAIARNAAMEGASVLYCTSKSAPRAALALASAISQVPFASLLGGAYSEGEARALDRATGKIKGWDLQFIEFDDRPKGFLQDLHRAITQTVGFCGAFSRNPRLIVIDSLLEAYLQEWNGAIFADALNELNEIAAQSRATLLFGYAGERFVNGFDLDSSLPHFTYATIELKEPYWCDRALQPELTIRGKKLACGEALLAWNIESRCVTDLLAPNFEAPGLRKKNRPWTARDAYDQGGRSRPLFPTDRLMRHEIMQTAMPFTERIREASVAVRDEQWRALKNWASRGRPDGPLELRDFEAFIAYEVGFEKEADSSYRSKGLCKALHDRVMACASSSDKLESQLLLSLLAAFAFMDDCINKSEDERPTYRFCG